MPENLYNNFIDFDHNYLNVQATNTTNMLPHWNTTTEYCIDRYVQQSELDYKMEELVKKIYRVIKDTARLDINEDDFIRLIQE